MTRLVGFAIGVAAWGGAIYASTQLHRVDLRLGAGICGPWGCAAKPEALLGYHLLLLALIAPGVALVAWAIAARQAIRLGRRTIASGLLGLVGLAGWGVSIWLLDGGSPRYAIQRGLFQVATSPDVPVVPLIVGGAAAAFVGRLRGGRDAGPERLEAPVVGNET